MWWELLGFPLLTTSSISYGRVNYIYHIVRYIPSTHYLITGGLYLSTTFVQLPLLTLLFVRATYPISFSMSSLVCFWSIIELEQYSFLVHNIVIWYFCTFQNDHHDKSSLLSATAQRYYIIIDYIPHTVWLICLLTESLYLLISLTYFSPPPTSGSYLFVLCTYDSVFCLVMFVHLLCFLDSNYKWNHTVFVLLCLTYFI